MLDLITIITSGLIVVSGLIVISMGDWTPYKLKFAPIVISTLAGLWMFCYLFVPHSMLDQDSDLTRTYQMIGIARNIAFILFHIAIGRDSIHYKKFDRRHGCSTMKK